MSAQAEEDLSATEYVARVLQRYRSLPGTTGRVRAADRCLARQLRDQRVPLALVEAAFVLAASRRSHREGAPLPPIQSLHYFLPIIRELELEPPPPGYLTYLQLKLARTAPSSK